MPMDKKIDGGFALVKTLKELSCLAFVLSNWLKLNPFLSNSIMISFNMSRNSNDFEN